MGGGKFSFDNLEKVPLKPISNFLENNIIDAKYIVKQPSMVKYLPTNSLSKKYGGNLRVIEDFCWTITTKQVRHPNSGIVKIDENTYRYLTERECWRFMGFSDEDFDKASLEHKTKGGKLNGTLYKQAGNSIVVQVLEAIFKELLNLNDTNFI